MPSRLAQEVERKARMQETLFNRFLIVFLTTAIMAVIAVGLILASSVLPEGSVRITPDVKQFAWALWGATLFEVAGAIFSLWRNLFDLSPKGTFSNLKNSLSEIIDGLESSGDISSYKADALRKQYSDQLGVSGTVYQTR